MVEVAEALGLDVNDVYDDLVTLVREHRAHWTVIRSERIESRVRAA